MKKFSLAIKAFILTACTATTVYAQDKVVASVDGNPILQSQINHFLNNPNAGLEERKVALEEAINALLLERLIQQTKVSVTSQELQAQIREIIASTGLNEQQFVNALMQQGLTPQQYFANLQKNMLIQKAVHSYLLPQVHVDHNKVVELAKELRTLDIQAGNEQKIQVNEYKVSHILLRLTPLLDDDKARSELNRIRDEILNHHISFQDAALRYSKDFASLGDGGSLGWNVPQIYDPSFAEKILSTPIGDISEPFKSSFGWHIIKVDEVREKDASEDYYLNRAHHQLGDEQIQILSQSLLDKLRQEAIIKYFP